MGLLLLEQPYEHGIYVFQLVTEHQRRHNCSGAATIPVQENIILCKMLPEDILEQVNAC